jgi:pantothenate synthetase
VAQLRAAAEGVLRQSPQLTLEYIDLADPVTLEALPERARVNEALLTVAVAVDGVRLLDERLLGASLPGERSEG